MYGPAGLPARKFCRRRQRGPYAVSLEARASELNLDHAGKQLVQKAQFAMQTIFRGNPCLLETIEHADHRSVDVVTKDFASLLIRLDNLVVSQTGRARGEISMGLLDIKAGEDMASLRLKFDANYMDVVGDSKDQAIVAFENAIGECLKDYVKPGDIKVIDLQEGSIWVVLAICGTVIALSAMHGPPKVDITCAVQ